MEIHEELKDLKSRYSNRILNYGLMIKEIDELTGGDFVEDMCLRRGCEGEFSQEDAREMAEMLGKIYTIAHCVRCRACSGRYEVNVPQDTSL